MRNHRRTEGYALVSIIVIGVFALTALLGLAASLTSVARSESYGRRSEELRVAAEAGIDYAINQFNSTYPCLLDPDEGVESKSTLLPADYLAATVTVTNEYGAQLVSNHVNNLTVSILVRRIVNTADWDYLASHSSIYSPQLDPRLSTSTTYANPPKTNVTSEDWRIIEATASYPGMRKTIRVILQPQYDPAPNDGIPPAPAGEQQPFFSNGGIFANTNLSFAPVAGDLTILEAGAGNGLTVQSNKFVNVGADTTLAGDLIVSSKSSGDNYVASNQGTIEGRVDLNGNKNPNLHWTPGPEPGPLDNVLATKAGLPRTGVNQDSPGIENVSPQKDQILMTPARQGNGQQTTLLQIDPESATITSGNYQTIGLYTSSDMTNPIEVDTSDGAVRIFVKDGANSNAVNIDTSKFITTNTNAREFQIWYSGNKGINIKLNGNDFNGLIYAPNAKVKTAGDGTFQGAIVADQIDVQHAGYMKLYTDLADVTSEANANAGIFYTAAEGSTRPLIQGYRAITWEELK